MFTPALLIALGISTGNSTTVWADGSLVSVRDKFGPIPSNLLVFTAPALPEVTLKVQFDLA